MLRNTFQSFALALQNIRANLFHTLLSVLGIVIGVAALVATFSLIDGLEKFARDQIASTTSMNALTVETETEKMVNNLPVRKDSYAVLDYERYAQFRATAPGLVRANLANRFNRELRVAGRDTAIGAMIRCVAEAPWGDTAILHGQNFPATAFQNREAVAVVNTRLAELIAGAGAAEKALGQSFQAQGQALRIVGVAKSNRDDAPPSAFVPLTLLSADDLRRWPPTLYLEVAKTEEVPPLKEKVQAWLQSTYGAASTDFQLRSQDFWIGQTAKGFLIFRVIMGLIIGISVVVGGVGVMNVLLISVNERTAEIGLRKAVGAKRGDIRRLFLAESITVSAFGSLVGLLLGAGFAMLAIPIVRFFADVPFHAVLTWNTFLVISIVAVCVGIVFGTYPAIKAARLDPVEALRRE
jgi:putative ABC transport system permease protein